MEFGDRSLGYREILADPRNIKTKDKINKAIKFRKAFRPFTPIVMEENVKEYFIVPNNENKVPFMEKIFLIKK